MLHILVPTDFSENAKNALAYGIQLYKNRKCTFHLLHVDPVAAYSVSNTAVMVASENSDNVQFQDSVSKLEHLVQEFREFPISDNHSYVTVALTDFFVDSIKREIESRNIDLIIMGTKGSSGIKHASMGSNTGDVITRVKCPLLAVPENAKFKKPKEISFPTDYHLGYDLKVLNTLLHMVDMNDANLQVLHISKKGEELTEEQNRNKEFLDDYLKDTKHSFNSLTGTDLETAVQRFTEARGIDMIAMVAKNLNFFQRILFRPKVELISYHTNIPFLVLHE